MLCFLLLLLLFFGFVVVVVVFGFVVVFCWFFIRVKYSFRCFDNGRVFSGDGFQHRSSVTGV